jgi:hypothetical protein
MPRHPSRPTLRPRTKLSLSRLEDRTVPDGNVAGVVSEGVLYLQGDDGNNAFWVQVTAHDQVTVLPYDSSTTVNGSSAPVVFDGVSRGYYLKTGGGNDIVVIDGAERGTSLYVDLGDGNDAVAISHSNSDHGTTILTGEGANSVSIGGSDLRGGTFIQTGNGSNTVQLGWTAFDNLTLAGGSGSNAVGMPAVDLDHPANISGFATYSSLIPVAVDDNASVTIGGTTTINVTTNDIAAQGTIDTSSVAIVSQPTSGTATVSNGVVTYTSTGTAAGTDSFTYTVKNSGGAVSAAGTVFVTIAGSTDTTAPTVTFTSSTTSPTKASSFTYTATFSEPVTGFTASGVTVSGGSVASVSAQSSTVYTVTVTPTTPGAVTAQVTAGAAQDAAGNNNTASSTVSITYDPTAPVVTANPLTTNAANPVLTGTVDDSTATVQVSVAGQTLTATVTGTTWSATATAVAEGTYTITVTATDPVGNVGTATQTNGLVVDRTAPNTLLTTKASNPTNATSFTANVTFNEPVTGFDASDVTISNGKISGFTSTDSQTYQFVVSPTTDGDVVVSMAQGAGTDAAGNGTTAASFTRTFDKTAPTVTVQPKTTNAADPVVTGTVNDSTAKVQVTVNGQTVTATVNGTNWTATFTGLAEGTYDIAVSATDAAGNVGTASATGGLIVDRTAPTVSAHSSTTNVADPVVTGTVDDSTATVLVTVNGQTVTATVNGGNWSATFTGLAEGTYDIAISATDAAGNTGTSTNAGGLIVDRTAPGLVVHSTTTNAADPVVTGTVDDPAATVLVTVNGQTVTATVNGGNWSATFTGLAEGTYDIAVSATDAAGNTGTATRTGGLIVDRTAPAVDIATTGTTAFTGTASDTSGVSGVDISIFDGTHYWDGSAFTATQEQFVHATSSDQFATWSYPFATTGSYTIHAKATDAAGNVGEKTILVTLS